ncbi:MAG: thiamine pyrophosphate-binding protein [Anaerolineae bacterium]
MSTGWKSGRYRIEENDGVSQLDTAGYIAGFLKAQGVQRVFGLPGGDNLHVIEALRRVGIDYVLVHHEAAATFMADADGQLNGRPGVCMATLGPGAVNLLAGVANSFRERAPVLAITADIDEAERPQRTHQEIDINALYQPVTKLSLRPAGDTVPEILPALWRLAMDPPWGPVHLTLSPVEVNRPVPASTSEPKSLPDEASESPPDLSEAVQRIEQAERIFIAAGIGVEQTGAQAELLALSEAWGTPVTVTPKAKGHFPENHRLFAGTYGAYGDEPLREALDAADLILAVGLDGIDFIKPWTFPAPVVSLGQAGADDPTFRPVLAYDGNLQHMLRNLTPIRQGDDASWAAAIRDNIARRVTAEDLSSDGTVAPHTVFRALRLALPANSMVTVDVGSHKLLILQTWVTTQPKTLFVSNGLSAMGYALPAAMALKLARPDVPVAAVTGDGGLLMYAGELETLARLGTPVVLVVLVDASLALIHMKQAAAGHESGYGVDFGGVDYRALAGAFGLAYRCIDDPESAQNVMAEAVALERPVLVEARIDKEHYRRFHQT